MVNARCRTNNRVISIMQCIFLGRTVFSNMKRFQLFADDCFSLYLNIGRGCRLYNTKFSSCIFETCEIIVKYLQLRMTASNWIKWSETDANMRLLDFAISYSYRIKRHQTVLHMRNAGIWSLRTSTGLKSSQPAATTGTVNWYGTEYVPWKHFTEK